MSILDQAGANATTNHTYEPADENLPLDDEDEFKARKAAWMRAGNIIKILYRFNVGLSVILSVGALVLFLVIFNKDVRRKSPLWYWLHIVLLSAYCGLGIHLPGYSESYMDNKSYCLYLMYSPEYVFVLMACLLILLNIEVFFQNLLQVKYWQNKQILRFMITVLVAWLITAFVVGHIVIENNIIKKSSRFCFRLAKKVYVARLAVRDWTPASICFLSSAVILITFCIQKTHPRFVTAMGNLRELTKSSDENGDQKSLMLMTLLMNAIFILRVILYLTIFLQPRRFPRKPDYYVRTTVVMLFHTQTIYLLPFPALFVAEVRSALRNTGLRCFRILIGIYKGRVSEDSDTLPVRIGDVKEES